MVTKIKTGIPVSRLILLIFTELKIFYVECSGFGKIKQLTK